jgi:hypothetical protein
MTCTAVTVKPFGSFAPWLGMVDAGCYSAGVNLTVSEELGWVNGSGACSAVARASASVRVRE